MLFANIHSGGVLVEDAPASDAAVELHLDERAAKTITALFALESFELSHALGQLWLAGVKEGHKASRRHPVTT